MNLLNSVIKPFRDEMLYRSLQAQGELYRIEGQKRIPIFEQCDINLDEDEQGSWCLHFQQKDDQGYRFPVRHDMQLVEYEMPPNLVHFEWAQDGQRLGCSLDQAHRKTFKDVVCRLMSHVAARANEDNSHLAYCKALERPPEYPSHSESSMLDEDLNDVLYKQAKLQSTRVAHTGQLFEVHGSQKAQREPVVLVVKAYGDFQYALCLFDRKHNLILEKKITSDMNYSLNYEESYLKWVHPDPTGQFFTVYLVEFDKYDVPQIIDFAFEQCLYEMRHRSTLEQDLQMQQQKPQEIEDEGIVPLFIPQAPPTMAEELSPSKILAKSSFKATPPPKRSTVVKMEDQLPTTMMRTPMEVEEPVHAQTEKKRRKQHSSLEKYRVKRSIVQAKVQEYTLESLGNSLQFLKIHDNDMEAVSNGQLFHADGRTPLSPSKIVLHDSDHKAMMLGENGHLSYVDLERMKIVEEYVRLLGTQAAEGVEDICPERKLAELGAYSTFLGLTSRGVHRLDPRVGGKSFDLGNFDYKRQKKFTHLTTTTEGEIAIGSSDGEIRLYPNDTKPTATVRYTELGDRVLHLQTTKDRHWLLATFKEHLILLPTSNAETSCYHKKLTYDNRPLAKKLTIDPKHLKMCKVASLQLVPAHFNESKDLAERYIVSGFDDYVVVWSLSRIINNNDLVYTFSKIEEAIDNVEFKFGDSSKMIMATSKRVRLKEGVPES